MNYISKETHAKVHEDPRMVHIFNELYEGAEKTRPFVSNRTEEDIFHFFTEAREYLANIWPDWNQMHVKNYNLGIWANRCVNNWSYQYEKHDGFLYKKRTGRFYDLDDFSDVTDSMLRLAEQAVKLRAEMIDDPWLQKVMIQGLMNIHSNTFNQIQFCDFIWALYR